MTVAGCHASIANKMNTNFWPEMIDPWQLAQANKTLTGTVALKRMPRLIKTLEQPLGEAEFVLKFIQDKLALATIHGKISTVLVLVCQRCMQSMNYAVDTEFMLSPVVTEAEALNLPLSYEPLVTAGQPVRVVDDILEEELLLCLPLVATHPPAQCSAQSLSKVSTGAKETIKKIYPLSKLAKLKQNLKTEE